MTTSITSLFGSQMESTSKCSKCSTIFDLLPRAALSLDCEICWPCHVASKLLSPSPPSDSMYMLYKQREAVLAEGIDFDNGIIRGLKDVQDKDVNLYYTFMNDYRKCVEEVLRGKPRVTLPVARECGMCGKMSRFIYGNINDENKLCCFSCRGNIFATNDQNSQKMLKRDGNWKKNNRRVLVQLDKIYNKVLSESISSPRAPRSTMKKVSDDVQETKLLQKRQLHNIKNQTVHHIGDIVCVWDEGTSEKYFAQILELFESQAFPKQQMVRLRWLYPCKTCQQRSVVVDDECFERGSVDPDLRDVANLSLYSRCPSPHFLPAVLPPAPCSLHPGVMCQPHSDKMEVLDPFEKEFCRQVLDSEEGSHYDSWRYDWKLPTPYQLKYCRKALDKKWFPLAKRLGFCKTLRRKDWLARIGEDSGGSSESDEDEDDNSNAGDTKFAMLRDRENRSQGFNARHVEGKVGRGPGRPKGSRGRPKKIKENK